MRQTKVRFIGGPYDGHYQDAPAAGAIERLTLRVSLDVFAALEGVPSEGDAATTSVAVYDFDESRQAYLFAGALPPAE